MSLRYGMRYSWYLGRESEPGRYRFTRNRTSASGMSVLPFDGLPPRDRHGGVVDARRAVRAVGERVLQIVRIVARWIIGATVRAPRLPAVPRAVRDRRRDVEHEVELEDRREFRVEHPVLVRQADVGEAIAQFGKLLARLDEAVRPVDRDARRLADGVEAGDVRLAPRVRRHAAHHVVLARPHGDRLADRVEAHVLLHELADHGSLLSIVASPRWR